MFLIFPKLVEIARLDPDQMVSLGLYNYTLREPVVDNANDGEQERDDGRREMETHVILPAQIETGRRYYLSMSGMGGTPESDMYIVLNRLDVETYTPELIDGATGDCLLKPRDRLVCVRDESGNVVQSWPNPPGMFVDSVVPSGFGFGFGGANLFVLGLSADPKGKTGGA